MNLLPVVRAREMAARADTPPDEAVISRAAEIVEVVRREGDRALLAHANALGDLAPPGPWVHEKDALDEALARIPAGTRECLARTAERIRCFAREQRRCLGDSRVEVEGGRVGHRFLPVATAGCYAPAGRYPLPSSVLMSVVPARAAGVRRVQVASPHPGDLMLAAAALAGADRVIGVGGAQAIAALAYGTETVERCDLIVGPGNKWVSAAKKLVYGDVGIDAVYGPTETMIIADESADPELVASDLLAQAEHDRLASPILLTPSRRLAEQVGAAIRRQLRDLERGKIANEAMETRGGCVLVNDIDHAIELANEYAPEHLCLVVENPTAYAMKVRNAGGLFLGENSPEAVGDYTAGPSHTMPTGGSARWSSPLGVSDFLKTVSLVNIPPDEVEELAEAASIIARAEGLGAHAASVERRLQGR